jgi:yecA family protein
MTQTVDIEQLKTDLIKVGNEASVSELHGMTCGLICGRGELDAEEWLSLTTEAIQQGDLLAQEASRFLVKFFNGTSLALSDNNLQFYPLLPEVDDDYQRLEGIAQWSQGFLMGLSLAGIEDFRQYPEEVSEFVEALTSLSSADEYDLEGDESDEESLTELIEFIRIGVLLVNEEMNPIRVPIAVPDDLSSDDTLH